MKIGKGLIVAGILVSTAVLLGGCPFMTYHNKEVTLRQAVIAQQKNNENVYDRVWKTISQQAQVANQYADQFKDIYIGIMTQRYTDGEARLAKFVQESSPVYTPDLMKVLMSTIESSRLSFEKAQASLIDKKREHDMLLQKFPSSFYVATILGRQPIDIVIVTSGRTTEAFESGQDNDVDVFGGSK